MADELSPFEEALECPVCLTVPREGPLPSCPAGHIVCKSCKGNLNNAECPTCRRPMQPGHVNYPLTGLIDKVRHFCKFRENGCSTKDLLIDLTHHEKECVYKSIKCPRCPQEVIMSRFYEHAVNSQCCYLFGDQQGPGLLTIFLPVRSPTDKTPLTLKDKSWKLACLQVNGEKFYVHVEYFHKSELMAIYVSVGPTGLSYQAKMWIDDNDTNNPGQNISVIRNVIPLDEASIASSSKKAKLAEKRGWFVPKCSLDSLINISTDKDGVSSMDIDLNVNILIK